MSTRHAARRAKLRQRIREQKLDALLVTNETNVTYLSGFSGDSTWLLVTRDHEVLISDSRYTTQLEEECPGVETNIRTNKVKHSDAAAASVRKCGIKSLGIEGHSLTIEQGDQLRECLAGVMLECMNWAVEELRAVKDADEIAETRVAVSLAARGFDYLKAILTPDMTELQLSHELEHAMRRFGASGVSFPPIIAVGDRGALPHYRPGDRMIGEAATLLVDWGAQTRSGYKSDLTRTLVTGKLTRKFEKIYITVLEAQEAAIAAIQPGARCADVDAIAREHIRKAGYGKYFGHGLGHGIGLNIHELPRLSPISPQCLEPGMVVTVEPGIYVPGWGGVRIEDDVLVTRDGFEVLSATVPKSLAASVIPTNR